MAITRTQIAKQLLAKGGRIGFFKGAQADASAGKGSMSPGTSGTGGMRGGNGGGGRDRDFQQRGMSKADYAKSKQTQNFGGQKEDKTIKDFINNYVKDRQKLAYNLSSFIPGQKERSAKMQRARIDYLKSLGLPIPEELEEELPSANFFVGPAFDRTSISYKDPMTDTVKRVKTYGEQIAEEFGAPGVMMSGNVGGLEKFVATRNPDGSPATFGYRNVGGGEGSNILLPQMMAQAPSIMEQELSPIELAIQQRDELGGARAFAKEGGIMDLETGRQMYLFGKLVKKAKKVIGKITKSPIGKAALLAAPLAFPSARAGLAKFLFKSPMKSGSGFSGFAKMIKGGLTGKGKLGIGAALTAAPLLFQKDDSEDEYAEFLRRTGRGPSIDIQGIRNDPYSVLARGFYAEGGKPEPVAKKTMPLLDMGGQEMDLRAEGGFVPIGRMEKADDVPARLSKNEFVFTADAVRNAGDGNVDKGAEVMYNMMKNLESGGDISEESQGLEGARKMFQTSQRLEEVL